MRRPTKEDFEATVQGTSIEVRFKPTNSTFLFAILADLDDVVAFGPVGPGTVRHGGPTTGDLDSYSVAADEVFAMAHEVARRAVPRHESRRM
jgi:hypothetical protein